MLNSRFLTFLLATAFLPGCSQDSEGRQGVTGTVHVDTVPVQTGSISFTPTEGQATAGGAVISNGKFAVPRDNGLLPGKYRVAISAPVPGADKPAPVMPGEAPPLAKDLIPPEWNTASKQIVEIKKGGVNSFPFEISSKSAAKK
ncbi:MAG TPA: hypothetical protein VGI40_09055 [Pirellulaceae bacterium]|jgi:hypothetical protein